MINIDHCPICSAPPFYTYKRKINFNKYAGIQKKIVGNYYSLFNEKTPYEHISFCNNCKTIYRSRFFDENEIKIIYEEIYQKYESSIEEEPGYVYNKEWFLRWGTEAMYQLVKDTEIEHQVKIKHIYDIGGRDGFRLRKLADHGYQCTVFDPIKINPCQDNIRKEYLWSYQINQEQKADFIFLCNILEHSISPQDLVYSCVALLKENGFLYIEVPADCERVWDWILINSVLKKNLAVDNTHFVFLTKRSIQFLVERHGLKLEKINYSLIPVVNAKILRGLAIKKPKSASKKWNLSLGYDIVGSGYIYYIFRRASKLAKDRVQKFICGFKLFFI